MNLSINCKTKTHTNANINSNYNHTRKTNKPFSQSEFKEKKEKKINQ